MRLYVLIHAYRNTKGVTSMNDTIKKLAIEWKEADAEWCNAKLSEERNEAWIIRAKRANILAMAVSQELGLSI